MSKKNITYSFGKKPPLENKSEAVAEHRKAMAEYMEKNGHIEAVPTGTVTLREGPLTNNQKKNMGMKRNYR